MVFLGDKSLFPFGFCDFLFLRVVKTFGWEFLQSTWTQAKSLRREMSTVSVLCFWSFSQAIDPPISSTERITSAWFNG